MTLLLTILVCGASVIFLLLVSWLSATAELTEDEKDKLLEYAKANPHSGTWVD